MANDDQINAIGGLRPVLRPYGQIQMTAYQLITDGTAGKGIFIGQPMDMEANSGGTVDSAVIGDNKQILGPVLGFIDINKAGVPAGLDSLTQQGFLPTNKDAFCLIADDPQQLFQIQEDTGGTSLILGNIGNHATFTVRTNSGSTDTGASWAELDRSDIAADTGGSLVVMGLVDRMNSDGSANTFGNFAKLLVRIVHHRAGGGEQTNAV